MVLGRVNKSGGVTASDATFPVDDLKTLHPPEASGTSLTAENSKLQAFDDNEIVVVFRNRDDDKWYAVKLGGGSGGATVVRFELTSELTLAATSADAKVLDDAGADAGETIKVVDTSARWMGIAAYNAADGTNQKGFRGKALIFSDDYASSGNRGGHIVEMEGFAPSIVVRMNQDVQSIGLHEATLIKTDAPTTGSNLCNKPPVSIGSGGGTGGSGGAVAVSNLNELAKGAKEGSQWEAGWSQKHGFYILRVPIKKIRQFILSENISPNQLVADARDAQTNEQIKVLNSFQHLHS